MSVLADCTLDGLVQASKCFDCLNAQERKALQVWFLAQALNSFGGANLTNYTTLKQTVYCLECAVSDSRLDSMLTAVYQKLASAAGATVDLPIATLRANISCQPCNNQKTNRAAFVYLQCALALISR